MYKVLVVGAGVLGVFLLTTALVQPLPKNDPHPNVDLTQITAYLEKDWDAQAKSPQQDERGYCVRFSETDSKDQKNYVAVDIIPGLNVRQASPYSIGFDCPKEWVSLHVHTPVTCSVVTDTATGIRQVLMSSCVFGGADAYNSSPSDADWVNSYLYWRKYRIPFHIIQWDRDKFHVYSPWDEQ